jgi:TRAP-type mannitol/chloroaromatic compound transport system permease large subunit
MIDMIIHHLGPLMFIGLFTLFLIGVPIAFSLAMTGFCFGLIGISVGVLQPSSLSSIPDNIWSRVMSNDTLLSIPFFTFMGIILERSGMAEALLDTMGKLFGPLRGGLAYAVIVVGALLAATTGIVAASVMTMGLIALPVMQRYNYNHKLAAGTIAASGTLAQIIPPSLVLIVLADQLGRSVGDMYAGALYPSLLLVGVYCAFVAGVTFIFPSFAPAIPAEARQFLGGSSYSSVLKSSIFPLMLLLWGAVILFDPLIGLSPLIKIASFFDAQGYSFLNSVELHNSLKMISPSETSLHISNSLWNKGHPLFSFLIHPTHGTLGILGSLVVLYGLYAFSLKKRTPQTFQGMKQVVSSIIPPLILIFLVLGTIFRGIATPTEGGAMGAMGAVVLAILHKKFNYSLLKEAIQKTVALSTFVAFILIGARVFSLVFYSLNGHLWIEHLFNSLPGGKIGFLVVVNIMIFFLAFFLDFFELVFIIVPLLVPVANKLGIDLVWFGVALAMNIQTSFMHPPFGFALFYLRSVAPKEPKIDFLTKRVIPPITTAQIYGGAIPYLCIQLLMVGIVISFPSLITTVHEKKIDMMAIEKQVPLNPELPQEIPDLQKLLRL